MLLTTYILFSNNKNKYYIGFISDELNERIRKNNSNHKGFTGGIGDWTLVYEESFLTLFEAHKRELLIKKWKSRNMIENLIVRKPVQSIPTLPWEGRRFPALLENKDFIKKLYIKGQLALREIVESYTLVELISLKEKVNDYVTGGLIKIFCRIRCSTYTCRYQSYHLTGRNEIHHESSIYC